MSTEDFGCCNDHLKCQKTGICNKPNKEHCMLYHGTVNHMFKALVQLKAKDLVTVEDNHLTDKGMKVLKDVKAPFKASILLWVIYVLGIHNKNRISPLEIKTKWKTAVEMLMDK
jgi:hypothetical protein